MKYRISLEYKIAFLVALAILIIPMVKAVSPTINSTTPFDGEMAVRTNSILSARISDADNNPMDITFSLYNGTSWRVLNTYTNVLNGNYTANTNGYMNRNYTDYQWKIVIDDHTGNIIEKNYSLKTRGLLKLKYNINIGADTWKGERQILPVMGDIDKDGIQEIVVAAGPNITAINARTGQIKWKVPGAEGTAVELVDLNNDGTPEILAATASNNMRLMAINGNGSIRWISQRLNGEHQSLYPIIAYDTDGDGYPTIYFAGQDSHPDPYSGNISEYNGAITMLDHNGNILNSAWVQKPCWGGFAIGDTNFDGEIELYMGDRREGYHGIPGMGLYALKADTLETLWYRPDIQHSSPMPVIADVVGDETQEIVGTQITLRGPLVIDAENGASIFDYQNKGLPSHMTAPVYDIDNDGHLEIVMGTSYPSNAPKDFAVFDLVSGVTEFRPTLPYHTAWPPRIGDVTGDGNMEIILAMGEQNVFWESYPLIVYNNKYEIIDQYDGTGIGQYGPARFFDVDDDGLDELVIGSANGRLLVFETQGVTPNPKPRTWIQEYSESRAGAPVYVDLPGPKAPFITNVVPANDSINVSANPKITIRAIDFQKDRFDVNFQIYQGFQWRQLAIYTNVSNGNYSTNTSPYVTDPATEYKWRVTLTDKKGNSKQYEYIFTTTGNINTTKPIVEAISPLDYQGAFVLSSLVFNITDNNLMTYNVTTSPNVGSAYVANVASGQYSVPISGLVNNQEYIWRISVTDGTSVTYKEYHFSTPWTLNISVTGNGAVQTNPLPPFARNAQVNITAIPNPGNTFLGWTGDYVSYSNPLTITMDTPKVLTATFIPDSESTIADGMFDQSATSLELIDNAPYQDWYESRNQSSYRNLLSLDENNVGGNTGKKAKLNGSFVGNAYLTQDFLTPYVNSTFTLQWDVYVDNILNINPGTGTDKAAIMMIGDNVPPHVNGPNYQASRNFVWLAFFKDGGAETGTVDLITTLNNGTETFLAPVTLDAWHTIKVTGDLVTDRYDVYLDNVLVGSSITARTNKNAVTHISFAQWNDGAGTFYIDNVGEPSGPIVCVDADSDGYNVTGASCGPVDCNDANAAVNPGATEVCNGIDDDCDGTIDEGCGGGSGTLDGWSYRKAVTIDNTKVSANINNFPVLIDLNDADLSSKAQPDGDDIVFTLSDGLTILSHEIESYDSGNLVAWVKTDLSSSTDTMIYMYYGNPAATNQEDAENVWDNNYLAVHHLEEKIGMAIDSTSNNNDGTTDNGIDQVDAGFIDNGYALDGVNDKVSMPRVYTSQNSFTIEGWINTGNKQGYIVSQRDLSSNGAFLQYYAPDGSYQMYVNNLMLRIPSTANQWHYVVGTYDGTTARLYIDAGTPTSGTTTITWPNLQTLIGDRSTGGRAFLGSVDEVRLSNVARSNVYIQTSYNNQLNPSTFYTVSVEEQLEACTNGQTQQCGTTNVGVCEYGLSTCTGGVWGSCVGNIEPITEVCDNGLDDDCDGTIDEGCSAYPDWNNRKTITVAKENVQSNINGFPLLVSVDDSDLAASAQADGDDIFFTEADGSTKLSHEIESYNSGNLVAWVKTDLSSSTDTMIYMYYGNPAATNQEDAENVWDNNYLTVQHLEDSGTTATDSNGNNDGTLLNGVSTGVATKIGDGFSFDGTNDRVTIPQLFSGQNQFTFEAWVNADSKQGYIVSQRDLSSNGVFVQYYAPDGSYQMYVNNLMLRIPSTANQWHYVVGTYDGTTARLYIDAGTPTSGSASLSWPNLQTLIGDRSALNRTFQGSIDELKISDVARSDAYVQTSFSNQNNPNTFITLGPEES